MKLREMRTRMGLTQKQLAEALDVPQETISRWENETYAIQQPTILRLAMEHLRCKARNR